MFNKSKKYSYQGTYKYYRGVNPFLIISAFLGIFIISISICMYLFFPVSGIKDTYPSVLVNKNGSYTINSKFGKEIVLDDLPELSEITKDSGSQEVSLSYISYKSILGNNKSHYIQINDGHKIRYEGQYK